jgi:hypothetical protein
MPREMTERQELGAIKIPTIIIAVLSKMEQLRLEESLICKILTLVSGKIF